jgi:xylulokinase
MASVILAVDAGTSAVKAALVTSEGEVLGAGSRRLSIARSADGHAVQSVADTFDALVEVSRDAVSGRRNQVGAVVVSSQRATMAGIGDDGESWTDWLSWQDHRGLSECDDLRASIGDERYYATTGLPLDPTAAVSKIFWLARHEPERFASTRWFVTHQGWLLHQLGADGVVASPSDAAYTGLLDVSTLRWDPSLCEAVGVDPAQLGDVVASSTVVGEVSAWFADRVGLSGRPPLVVGGGDLQCGAVGLGATRPGVLTVGLGTGGHCVASVPTPVFFERGAVSCQPHVLPDVWELEGIALSTASTWEWAARVFAGVDPRTGTPDWTRAAAALESVEPGSDGVVAVPRLNGAGSPDWRPDASGAFVGLRLTHTPAHLLRATAEGIVFELRRIKDVMASRMASIETIRVWGGPAQQPFWPQLVADVFDAPVCGEPHPYTGLVGAAVLGAAATGLHGSVEEAVDAMVRPSRRVDPDPTRAATYKRSYEAFAEYSGASSRWATVSYPR